ncbi:hypothetical protein MACJ_000632 [Theileria orientalis]|uniref:Protein YIPF n=1 Tax=Theileria orientalis TaxID=68886 RepID=A0A976M4D1_THEOR|nr:hypothetical protein MACJ_000632 [Theileria orientalis]
MTGNLRSRHAFHNTFGGNTSENENEKKFPNQGAESYSNTSSVTHPFQNQSSLQHSSGPVGSAYTATSSIATDSSIGSRTNVSSKSYTHGTNVSSPFPKTYSIPANTTSSPFSATTSVPNPNVVGSHGFQQGTPVSPVLQYGSGYGGYPGEPQNLNAPAAGFATAPSYSAGGCSASASYQGSYSNFGPQTYSNASPGTFSQSQKPQDNSMMYLDGQLNQNTFANQPVASPIIAPTSFNTPGFNPNAVGSNMNANSNTGMGMNANTVNLSNLSRTSHSTLSTHNISQTQIGFSPLPAQLGAQLTKFGEIYNQRLQQSDGDDEVDPPLLDELGINVVDIYNHMVSVMLPKKGNLSFQNYDDLYGPLLIFVAFAVGLMVSGKICFSTIYVLFVFCNLGIYMLFNFLNETYISFSKTVTILGYSLLPLCITPVFGLLSRFIRIVPVLMVYVFVLWSTVSASYLFQVELNLKYGLHFIMYPILLYYVTFANVVIY